MFFDVFSPLVDSSSQSVIYPEWDEREEWIENHNYDPDNVNWCSLDVHNFKRDTGILKYYAFYTIDNVYEYYVFRSLIIHLNKLGGLEGKRSFTLGHYMPFKKGGVHFPSNWIIQTQKDNTKASDKIPDNPNKWTWEEQYAYIMANLPEELNQEFAWITMRRLHQVEKFY
ncbi:hypothetical protein MVUOKPPV_CDS0228 [Klebsiella phage phi1_175008]|uniref:Uncharacterized protein n=2 Tax=Klebsiella phage phi1_175008 TaxID=3127744 RepID=A0ACD5FSL4_9CAUD